MCAWEENNNVLEGDERQEFSATHELEGKNQTRYFMLTKNVKLTRKIKIAFSNKVTVKSTKEFQVHVWEEMQNQLTLKFTELLCHK